MRLFKGFVIFGLLLAAFGARADDALHENLRRFTQVQTQILQQSEQAPTDVQQKVSAVPTLPPPPADSKPQTAPSDKEKVLIDQLNSFASEWQRQQRKFSSLAAISIIGTAVLALIAGILSFIKKNRTAGIVSLLVTAIVTVSSAYPLGSLADFYRGLTSKVASLQLECKLNDPLSVDAFNSISAQLQALILDEGTSRPSLGKNAPPDSQTADQLTQLRVSTTNIEKSRAQ
jgi:hypothetical protein